MPFAFFMRSFAKEKKQAPSVKTPDPWTPLIEAAVLADYSEEMRRAFAVVSRHQGLFKKLSPHEAQRAVALCLFGITKEGARHKTLFDKDRLPVKTYADLAQIDGSEKQFLSILVRGCIDLTLMAHGTALADTVNYRAETDAALPKAAKAVGQALAVRGIGTGDLLFCWKREAQHVSNIRRIGIVNPSQKELPPLSYGFLGIAAAAGFFARNEGFCEKTSETERAYLQKTGRETVVLMNGLWRFDDKNAWGDGLAEQTVGSAALALFDARKMELVGTGAQGGVYAVSAEDSPPPCIATLSRHGDTPLPVEAQPEERQEESGRGWWARKWNKIFSP